MSNSLDPDQVLHYIGPDLGPYCLQRLSVDCPSRYSVNIHYSLGVALFYIITYRLHLLGEAMLESLH